MVTHAEYPFLQQFVILLANQILASSLSFYKAYIMPFFFLHVVAIPVKANT